MRQIVITSTGKTVLKTSAFVAMFAFVTGILTIMLMDDKGIGFIPAVLSAIGIILASTLLLFIGIFAACWIFVMLKSKYDHWYATTGFRKDLEKLAKKGLINPAHAKVDPATCKPAKKRKASAKKEATPKKKLTKKSK